MMTDREMLELAAKAAGIDALRDPDGVLRDCTGSHPAMNIFGAKPWNPLIYDGDALRLAINLDIDVAKVQIKFWDKHSINPYAATRRAIVRAAAEIGKGIVQTVSNDLPEDNYYKTQAEAVEVAADAIRKGE
jgi:hypothetical protein